MPSQARGKTKLSDAMAAVKDLREYDKVALSLMERQAFAKFNLPASILVGEVGSYASAKAYTRNIFAIGVSGATS